MTRHKRRRKGSTQEALDARGGDIARDGVVLDLGLNRYKVSSQSVPDAYYEVTVMHVCWKCTCPYHVRRGDRCKHVRAVQGIVKKIRECRLDVLRIGYPGVVCVSCKLDDCKHRETRSTRQWHSIFFQRPMTAYLEQKDRLGRPTRGRPFPRGAGGVCLTSCTKWLI